MAEKFEMASRVEHLSGLELCYPQDFGDPQETKDLLAEYRLGVSAINFRCRRNGRWLRGSFSSQVAAERAEVVEDLKRAIDGCSPIV